MSEMAIQDYMADSYCFGCGPGNPNGLQIKSYWDGEKATCTFAPSEHHSAGPPHVLNGGIIATVIDCHAVCTACAHAYHAEGRAPDSDPPIWCVTGSLHVDYLRPTPIEGPVELVAKVIDDDGKKMTVECELRAHGKPCANAKVVAVRVPPEWKAG